MFLLFEGEEALYGGAGGGGKSDVGLMDMLRFVEVDGFAGLILRRTMTALRQPKALLDRATKWFAGTKAHWHGLSNSFRFPGKGSTGAGGASITFGGLENRKAYERYDSAEFQRIYIDELTQFQRYEYERIQSRLRRPSEGPLSEVPLGIRAGANPGGQGHEWVKSYFVNSEPTADKIFIKAVMEDNPYLDRPAYLKTLQKLPPRIREAILKGNWDLDIGAGVFRRDWFKYVDALPSVDELTGALRYWDTAGTEDTGDNDPDATAGVLELRTKSGLFVFADVEYLRDTSDVVIERFKLKGIEDLKRYPRALYLAVKEQQPGSDSKGMNPRYARIAADAGFRFKPDPKRADKIDRASGLAIDAGAGRVRVYRGEYDYEAFIDELVNFPTVGTHDDRVDGASGAHFFLNGGAGVKGDGILEHMRKKAEAALADRTEHEAHAGDPPHPQSTRRADIEYARRR